MDPIITDWYQQKRPGAPGLLGAILKTRRLDERITYQEGKGAVLHIGLLSDIVQSQLITAAQ